MASLFVALVLLPSTAGAQIQDDGVEIGAAEPAEVQNAGVGNTEAISGGIEEMLVQGSSHNDLLQDVGVSVSTFDADAIKSLRIQNIADLSEYTPNLEINKAFAASNPNIFIRGIGLKDYNANAPGAVAVYQDGININAPAIQLGQLFDIDTIEVLRGPQGSINGRNATAGAILINSALPGDELEATGSFSYGNYNNLQGEAALTVPIIEDMLSFRFAGTANFRDGTLENQCADWDPSEHGLGLVAVDSNGVDLLAQNGIDPAISAASTQQIYAALNPHPVPVLVRQANQPASAARLEYVYLNGDFAKEISSAGISTGSFDVGGTGRNPELNRLVLGENVGAFNEGHRVAVMAGQVFQLEASAGDQVCILASPGRVVNPLGEAQGNPLGPAGDYVPVPGIPDLSDFQGLSHRLNDIDNWAGRGIMRFQPIDGMEWLVNAHGGQNRGGSSHLQMLGADAQPGGGFQAEFENGFSEGSAAGILKDVGAKGFEGVTRIRGLDDNGNKLGLGGDDPYKGFYNRDGDEILDSWGISLRGRWDLDPFVITLLGGYETYDRFVEDEGDANPLDIFPATYDDSAEELTTEVRLEGDGDGYRWGLGAFYLHEQLDAVNLFPNVRQTVLEQTYDQLLESWSVYGNGRYWITEEVSAEAGVRYNSEFKSFGLESVAVPVDPDGSPFEEVPASVSKDTWTAVTGDFTLYYEPKWDVLELIHNDSLNIYAKYARGFKGGHFNASTTFRADGSAIPSIDPVQPEFIHAVEVGWKSSWLEDRLAISIAGFRYWYTDLQVFDILNDFTSLPTPVLLNSDARVWGAELELNMRPLPALLVQISGGWLNARFKDFEVEKTLKGRTAGQTETETFDYDGNPLISAPTWSLSNIVEYTIPLGRYGSLIPQYDSSYRSKVYLDPSKQDPISQDAYWLHNARLAYTTPGGNIEISGWVQNFLNQQYVIDTFDVSREFNTILQVFGDPRTYGMTITYTW